MTSNLYFPNLSKSKEKVFYIISNTLIILLLCLIDCGNVVPRTRPLTLHLHNLLVGIC